MQNSFGTYPHRYKIQKKSLYGLMDDAGEIVVPPTYSYLEEYAEGCVAARINGKTGYLDAEGAVAISPAYDEGKAFSEGLAAVRVGKLWGYINPTGEMAVPPKYGLCAQFSEGLAAVAEPGKPENTPISILRGYSRSIPLRACAGASRKGWPSRTCKTVGAMSI